MRSPKSRLLKALQSSVKATTAASGDMQPASISRRRFLATAAGAGLWAGLSSIVPEYIYAGALQPVVAIIGAGIAGLNAGHYLKKHGIIAPIYEAATRTGGRIFTKKNGVVPGYTAEIGAEFIDSGHIEMHRLARELGLQMKDAADDPLYHTASKDTYFINGKSYTLQEVTDEFRHYIPLLKKDVASLGERYDTPAAQELDGLSIAAYFDKIQLSGWLRTLLDNAYYSEFGLPVDMQSSLNFLTMISVEEDEKNGFSMYGSSDERFGIAGGNSLVTEGLAARLSGQINTEYMLQAIKAKGSRYILSFSNGREILADYVIITIPFTILRKVEIAVPDMPPEKIKLIRELGYGDNAKLIMGFNRRCWREDAQATGYLFNEAIQNGWDSSLMQHENKGAGSYTVYVGAEKARAMALMKEKEKAVGLYLPGMDLVFPGSAAAYNGNVIIADWPVQPFIQASYAAYKVGQWTTLAGREGIPAGQLYFAGEHCSVEFQGFMNGGAETGKKAAMAVLQSLSKKRKLVF